ncbi:MAG: cytochrome c [Chloroflexota bacterium]
MLKKLLLTAFAFLCIGTILGYSALQETSRMGEMTAAQNAKLVEQGAAVYYEHCANCHGQNGRAEECINQFGEQIACSGRSLNNSELLCKDQGIRLQTEGWEGTAEEYILNVTTVGKSEKEMPPFGLDYRYDAFTALNARQIQDVTAFILEYELGYSCTPSAKVPNLRDFFPTVNTLPEGDAEAGEELYKITFGCVACHGEIAVEGSNVIGPWVGNFKNLDDRIEGYTAADYLYESILLPNAFISPDCPTGPCVGPPGNMPDNFGLRMSVQNIADVIAYLGVDASVSNEVVVEYPPLD